MYKIIRIKNFGSGGSWVYFKDFSEDLSNPVSVVFEPIDAERFIPKDVWYKEERLNETLKKLEEKGFECEIMKLTYQVESY